MNIKKPRKPHNKSLERRLREANVNPGNTLFLKPVDFSMGENTTPKGPYWSMTDQRVLLTGQYAQSENGIWVIQLHDWIRPDDLPAGANQLGAMVYCKANGWLYRQTSIHRVGSPAGCDWVGLFYVDNQQERQLLCDGVDLFKTNFDVEAGDESSLEVK